MYVPVRVTKKQATEMYGSGTALAAALGVTKQAVGSWDVDSNIPELQALKLLVLNPELFTDNWVLKAG